MARALSQECHSSLACDRRLDNIIPAIQSCTMFTITTHEQSHHPESPKGSALLRPKLAYLCQLLEMNLTSCLISIVRHAYRVKVDVNAD